MPNWLYLIIGMFAGMYVLPMILGGLRRRPTAAA